MLLLAAIESVLDMSYGVGGSERTVKEVARTRLLHHVGSRVAAQLTESVIAEDYRLVLYLGVGDHEVTICHKRPIDVQHNASHST